MPWPDPETTATTAFPPHPRRIGWIPTVALAIGGSNQSLFLIAALFVGQDGIEGQGSAAIPLLIVGLFLSFAAAPGWVELVLLSRNRVGGIAAACTDAFAPYSPMLSALTGCCYWWGWIPTCGLTSLIAASALHAWFLPSIPTNVMAVALIVALSIVAMSGMRTVARFAVPIGIVSTILAFLSGLVPIVTGHVDWHQATTFTLITPFHGLFGSFTALMAGLYLVGFAAPAFEAATCHVGETVDPDRNVPRAVAVSGGLAFVYFAVLPLVWLGTLGPAALGRDLAQELGPTYAPLFGAAAKSVALGFIAFSMFHGTLQPLAGASRTLSQLADDGVFPRFLGRRNARDVPWIATTTTAVVSIAFVFIGDPIWLVAAANFAYLISIGLANVAVALLRRDAPHRARPYRAPKGTIALGVAAGCAWAITAIFGFQQFGLPTILMGLGMAYAGGILYGWRKIEDRRRLGRPATGSIHLTLSVAMIFVLFFDAAGYLIAIRSIPVVDVAQITMLEDLFVLVAMLTIAAGLVMPGMISSAATAGLARVNETLVSEIDERRIAEERLSHLATHDELTGLANRPLFMDRFHHLVARMQRAEERLAAVLFLDLDRFKLVNDSLGHAAGDALLVATAGRLERCLRTSDTLARLGGDEFAILIEHIADQHEATIIAERILRDFTSAFVVNDREIFTSVSIGIAITHVGSDTPEDTLRNADVAMYEAKRRGKGRFEVFAADLLLKSAAAQQLEHDLKRAVERREFTLAYQPIIALASGDLIGFEALIRWQHPERGLVMPDAFIAAAEECGTIVEIGAWVIDEGCRQLALWQKRFRSHAHLAMSVNVSAKQLANRELVEHIAGRLIEYGLEPHDLHVEVTESAFMSDIALATTVLAEIRASGVAIHLDDFGTGYSSLGYLQRFPVDTLKIDRSFVSLAGTGIANVEILRTITTLAQSLSLTTTAEGIETVEQLDALRELGCTHGQGYYLSKPVNANAAERLIRDWHLKPFVRPSVEPYREASASR